jgi:hypothetical protein
MLAVGIGRRFQATNGALLPALGVAYDVCRAQAKVAPTLKASASRATWFAVSKKRRGGPLPARLGGLRPLAAIESVEKALGPSKARIT